MWIAYCLAKTAVAGRLSRTLDALVEHDAAAGGGVLEYPVARSTLASVGATVVIKRKSLVSNRIKGEHSEAERISSVIEQRARRCPI